MDTFKFEELHEAPLIPGATYLGGSKGNAGDDPISKLMGVGNAGGMRVKKKNQGKEIAYLVLVSSAKNNEEYPDSYDAKKKILTYYGDQRTSGLKYEETRAKGNINLKQLYDRAYLKTEGSKEVFPCFYFEKLGNKGRNYVFHGLAYPFVKDLPYNEVCKEVYLEVKGEVVNNLQFKLTINDSEEISHSWLDILQQAGLENKNAPQSWKQFLRMIRNDYLF